MATDLQAQHADTPETLKGIDCPCGRGTAIGTLHSTDSRVTFIAFVPHTEAVSYHFAADAVCADCVSDAVVWVARYHRPFRVNREWKGTGL